MEAAKRAAAVVIGCGMGQRDRAVANMATRATNAPLMLSRWRNSKIISTYRILKKLNIHSTLDIELFLFMYVSAVSSTISFPYFHRISLARYVPCIVP